MVNVYEAQARNKAKSIIVVVLFLAFVFVSVYLIAQALAVYQGYELGGLGLVGLALIVSGVTTFFSYYFSDRIVLVISGAVPANRRDHFNFYTTAENLAIAAGLPKPTLYVIKDTAPNAFAIGRDPKHAVICVTTGLLEKLSRTELEGVIAHEMTHVRNYDIRLQSLVAVMVGLISLLGDFLLRTSFRGRSRDSEGSGIAGISIVLGILFAAISPLIARLIHLAISRRREFLADSGSVALTRQPEGLIRALEKISADSEPLEAANKATAHLYVVNPFKGKMSGSVSWFANLFNTHPPVAERIKALKNMI